MGADWCMKCQKVASYRNDRHGPFTCQWCKGTEEEDGS